MVWWCSSFLRCHDSVSDFRMMKKTIILLAACLLVSSPASANSFVIQFENKQKQKDKHIEGYAAAIISERFQRNYNMQLLNVHGFIKPTIGAYTSGFAVRDIGEGLEHHKGLDMANVIGTDIKASMTGTVYYAGWMGGYGNVIILEHTYETKLYSTVYAHLSSIQVIQGQNVMQGQSIAKMGSTGRSTGSHLHFEIHEGKWNGARSNAVNPLKYSGGW